MFLFGKNKDYTSLTQEGVAMVINKNSKQQQVINFAEKTEKPKEPKFHEFLSLCRKHVNDKEIDEFVFRNYTKNVILPYLSYNTDEILTHHKIVLPIIIALHPEIIFNLATRDHFNIFFPTIAKKINGNLVDSHNQTFMFYIQKFNNITTVLRSDLDFNVNHTCKSGMTFLTSYLRYNTLTRYQYYELLPLLQERNYNFNNVSTMNRSIFSAISNLNTGTIDHEILKDLLNMPEIDVTIELTWLKLIIDNYGKSYNANAEFCNAMLIISIRNDYASFLFKLITKYIYYLTEEDFLKIILTFESKARGKLINMLQFKDDNGNTFIHVAARHRYKKILNLTLNLTSLDNIKIGKNNDNKYPLDLYLENKLETRLGQIRTDRELCE